MKRIRTYTQTQHAALVLRELERAHRPDDYDDLTDLEDQLYSTERIDGLETRSRERRRHRLAARRRAA